MATNRSALREEIRALSDSVDDPHITDTDLNGAINRGLEDLHHELIKSSEDYYLTTSSNQVVASGSSTFALPSGYMFVRGVDRQVGDRWVTVFEEGFSARNSRNGVVTFRVENSNIVLRGKSDVSGTYRVHYIPGPFAFTSDTTLDDRLEPFRQYLIWKGVHFVGFRQGKDTLMATAKSELEQARGAIKTLAVRRHRGGPAQVPLLEVSDTPDYWTP